jgi:EAL domain-containing protein (putative c-di-GMP-specific phosphodiesterase class I)/CheY-like chemotaxis protein
MSCFSLTRGEIFLVLGAGMQIADLNFLVADSDEFQRRWLMVMLANAGATNIVEVTDGVAALHVLQDSTHHIDISVIDLNMPLMDGMELIRHLARSNHQTAIIVASGLDSALLFSVETMSKAYGIDLLGTMEKPATPSSLMAIIHRYQGRKVALTACKAAVLVTIDDVLQGLKAQEFEPHFQPKIVLATGRVKGVEAFARWHHPRYGYIPPNNFIPILEQHEQMDVLTWVIIEKSVAACRSWHDKGYTISVSINVSPSSMARQGLSEQIIARLARYELDPQYVIFEVSESSAVTNVSCFLENLTRLRMKGYGISVDDYGAGCANMQELLRIPFSEIKIDRSFVAGAAQNKSLELVLRSSLELCQKLNRQSVAVGVETRQDWDLLSSMGCTFVQGYYIAKPMPGNALPRWMEEWELFF